MISSLCIYYIRIEDYLSDFFGQLPLQDDLDNDTKMEEVNAYLNGKINNFFGNIRLSLLNDDIYYDAQGEVSQRPVIYAQYSDNKSGNIFFITEIDVWKDIFSTVSAKASFSFPIPLTIWLIIS